MIKINNLSYQYPNTETLYFPDFEVAAGRALLVRGESGCGKTTLLHLLAGLRKPTDGEILIDGKAVSEMSSAKMDQFRGKHIGLVYQKPYFIESLSVLDNLLISPYAGTKSRAKAVANRLHINNFLHRLPSQLSVGQQQRATIARAVMNEPKLLLADEPTSALDNKNCTQVIDLLLEEALANNAALIIVTHDDRLQSEIRESVELSPVTI